MEGPHVSEIVDIAEAAKDYKDEWLLFEVTEVDELDQAVKGRLLFHGKSWSDLHTEAMKVRDMDTYAFFTGPAVPRGMVVVL